MPSSKPKVFAYLPQELYDRVSEFKLQRQLPSDSQALVAILTEFFDCPKPKIPVVTSASNTLEQRVERLEQMFDSLNLMVLGLLHAEPLEELEETNSSVLGEPLEELEETNSSVLGELMSKLQGIDSRLHHALKGKLGDDPKTINVKQFSELLDELIDESKGTNGSVPGEPLGGLEETNSSVPGEPLGELEETNSSVPGEPLGELEETNSSVPGEPLREQEETNSSVPGEPLGGLEETNSSVPGEPLREQEETNSSVPDKNQHFVICLVDKRDPGNPQYWVSQKIGFTHDLEKAKLYQSESSLKRQKNRLEKSTILSINNMLSYRSFGELKQMELETTAAAK